MNQASQNLSSGASSTAAEPEWSLCYDLDQSECHVKTFSRYREAERTAFSLLAEQPMILISAHPTGKTSNSSDEHG